ncbi:MAG: SxtJ family membrane protein [Kiloniellales bacterium]
MASGHHEDFRRDETIEVGSDRWFGCVFAVVFVVIALWLLWDGRTPRWWALVALVVAAAFLVPAIAAPRLLRPLNHLWHRFGLGLTRFISPIVLAFLFYLVVTPIGLVMRLAGKDPLRLQWEPKADSYWIERKPPGPKPDTMKNQF